MRAIKQPSEIKALEHAAKLTVDAFEAVKQQIATYKYEYEIEADFTAWFRRHDARHAYEPIVAAGQAATTLHYIGNNQPFHAKDLVLIDIGARKDGYCADVTRTYAKRQPSKRQVAVHHAVTEAQTEIIGLLRPGLSVREYHEQVDKIMVRACKQIGLVATDDETLIRRYMPHAVSHGLGIDTHDALGRPTEFVESMVLTVEPGIYIPEEGVGVRIEDDILVTAQGHRSLTGRLSTDW